METHALRKLPKRWSRRKALLALAGIGLATPACTWDDMFAWNDGKPTLFWYRTAPNYDTRIKTVRLKIFKNNTPWAVVPVPGLEMQLTQALQREIEQKTPFKVVQGNADTEISGSIKTFTKINLNYNQLNEVRECETTLVVEVLWKDLKTGEVLSAPSQRSIEPLPPAGLLPGQEDPLNAPNPVPGAPLQPPIITAPNTPGGQPATMAGGPQPIAPPGVTPAPSGPGGTPGAVQPQGVLVRSIAHFRPELGESISTAQQKNINRMAEQIVSMMEKPW
jgi:hypothetical protein